jgi:hypothetical protein
LIIFLINFQGGTVLIWGFGKILLGKNTPPQAPAKGERNEFPLRKKIRKEDDSLRFGGKGCGQEITNISAAFL